jgi:hypothetical protein
MESDAEVLLDVAEPALLRRSLLDGVSWLLCCSELTGVMGRVADEFGEDPEAPALRE